MPYKYLRASATESTAGTAGAAGFGLETAAFGFADFLGAGVGAASSSSPESLSAAEFSSLGFALALGGAAALSLSAFGAAAGGVDAAGFADEFCPAGESGAGCAGVGVGWAGDGWAGFGALCAGTGVVVEVVDGGVVEPLSAASGACVAAGGLFADGESQSKP